MTLVQDTPVRAPDAPLVAKKPPKYQLGSTVVLKRYEDGWRWTVVDAHLKGRRDPVWHYWVETARPYDGKAVRCEWPEWKLRPVPEAADR